MAKKFKGTLEEGFLNFIETNGQETFGYVNVTTRTKKVGRVFVRYGTITAIENQDYRTNIFERVISIEGMTERNIEMLRQRFMNDEANINIVEAALDQQMASGAELSKIVKENFIDSFYNMWQWGQVVLEWVPNKDPQVPTVPAIQPADLVQKAQLIEHKVVNEIAPMFGVRSEDILSLIPRIGNNEDYSTLRANEKTILQYSSGEHSLEDIIYSTGISLSGSQFAVARLWLNSHLYLSTPSGELIVFENPEEELEEEEVSSEDSYQEQPEQYSAPEVEEYVEPEQDFEEETVEEYIAPEPPIVETEDEESDDEDEETLNDFDSFFTNSSETEILPEEEISVEPDPEPEPAPISRPRKLSFQEALAMTETPEELYSDLEDDELTRFEHTRNKRSTPTSSSKTSSRIGEIVEQLRSLMEEAKNSLEESNRNLHQKKDDIEELYSQKRDLNSKIMEAEEEYSALIETKQVIYNDYKEIIKQFKGMEGTL